MWQLLRRNPRALYWSLALHLLFTLLFFVSVSIQRPVTEAGSRARIVQATIVSDAALEEMVAQVQGEQAQRAAAPELVDVPDVLPAEEPPPAPTADPEPLDAGEAAQAELERLEAEAAAAREEEQRRLAAEAEREAVEAARRAEAERQAAAAAEVARQAEQRRQEEARRLAAEDAARAEAQRRAAEALAEEQRREEARRRVEAERRAEAEREAAYRAAVAAERERRLAEEAAMLAELEERRLIEELSQERIQEEARQLAAAEQRRLAAEEARRVRDGDPLSTLATQQLAREADRYIPVIRDRVRQFWVRPPASGPGLETVVSVRLIPGGDVIPDSVRVVRSSGNTAFDQSVVAAINQASPLPVPSGPPFERFREFNFTFKP
jgi:colicin import membrane protein